MKMSYTYKTEIDKNGNLMRYRCWKEPFTDEDTGEVIWVKRRELMKVNGEKVRFYSTSEWKRMSPAERDAIRLRLKK